MEDEDFRTMQGTAADFSNWTGIKAEGAFRSMNVISRERVIEPAVEEETKTDEIDLSKVSNLGREEKPTEEPKQPAEEQLVEPKKDLTEMPGKEIYANPAELKTLAIKLLPTVDKVSKEEYNSLCEKAIEMAFAFETVWSKKVSFGE